MRLSTIISRLCAACLAFLGYSCNEKEYLDMYGAPTGDWEIKGKVSDEAGQAVSNVAIKVTFPEEASDLYSIGMTRSDDQGDYVVTGDGLNCFPMYKIVCIPDTPTLRADSTVVEMHYVKDKEHKDEFLYIGSAEATVNFILKAYTDEEDTAPTEVEEPNEEEGNTTDEIAKTTKE